MRLALAVLLICSGFLIGCKKSTPLDCSTKLKGLAVDKKNPGTVIRVKCPADCSKGSVWGTDIYTTDSNICTAAVHAGVIKASNGGKFKIVLVESPNSYSGSKRHGIRTSSWSSKWRPVALTFKK